MSSTLDTLHQSADLAKLIGNTVLPNGKLVREQLSVDGVSFWDTVSPQLAAFWFPKDLSRAKSTIFDTHGMPYLRRIRQQVKSITPFPRNSAGCTEWPSGRVCLFLGFSGYMYRDILEPVKKHFDKTHGMNCVVLHDGGSFQNTAVKLAGTGIHSIWEHWESSLTEAERVARKKFSSAICEIRIEDMMSGFSPDEKMVIGPKIAGTLRWLLLGHLSSLIPYYLLARHILEKHPNSIIVSSDQADPRARLFSQIGKRNGIPSLEVQFGLCAKDGVEWQFLATDKVAVWGDNARKVISSHGVADQDMVVTGSPRFDCLVDVPAGQARNVRGRMAIPEGKTFVLFASQYLLKSYCEFGDFANIQRSIKRAIFRCTDKLDGMVLVVKPHPLEDVEETRKLAAGCKNIVFADKSEDIRELTKACDVFVTLGSTATMEALIAGKLVIYPAFPGFVWWDDMYLRNNVAFVVESEEILLSALRNALSGMRDDMLNHMAPARQKFLNEMIYKADGKAATRVSMLVEEMAKR